MGGVMTCLADPRVPICAGVVGTALSARAALAGEASGSIAEPYSPTVATAEVCSLHFG